MWWRYKNRGEIEKKREEKEKDGWWDRDIYE